MPTQLLFVGFFFWHATETFGARTGGPQHLLMSEPPLFFILDVKLLCPSVIKQNTARMGVPTVLLQGLQSESGGLYVQNNT